MKEFFKHIFFIALISVFLIPTYIIVNKEIKFSKTAHKVQGTVVNMVTVAGDENDTFAPIIEFKTADEDVHQYQSSVSSNPPAYRIGEKVDIYYDSKDLKRVKIDNFTDRFLLPSILGAFGGFFLLIYLSVWIFLLLKKKRLASLAKNSRIIHADSYSVKELSKELYVIYCQWKDDSTGNEYIFKSSYIMFDPTRFIENRQISIQIDPENYSKYHVDTSFLPKVA